MFEIIYFVYGVLKFGVGFGIVGKDEIGVVGVKLIVDCWYGVIGW